MKWSNKIPNVILLGIIAFQSSILALVAFRKHDDAIASLLFSTSSSSSLPPLSMPSNNHNKKNSTAESISTIFITHEPSLPMVVPVLAHLPSVSIVNNHTQQLSSSISTSPTLDTTKSTSSSVSASTSIPSSSIQSSKPFSPLQQIERFIPSSLPQQIMLAADVYFMIVFPLQKITIMQAKLALRLGRSSAVSVRALKSLSAVRRIASRSTGILLKSKAGRAVMRPIVSIGKAVRSVYRNRSKLSIVSELTYYADLPVVQETTDYDDQVVSVGIAGGNVSPAISF